MASSGSSSIRTCEDRNHQLVEVTDDQRKRKRMIFNRESAKRSRARKQKHLDDLMAQIAHLRGVNNQILTNMSIVTQLHMNVESKNSVLRAQMSELNHRLQALNDIVNSFQTIGNGTFEGGDCYYGDHDHHDDLNMMISSHGIHHDDDYLNYSSSIYVSQPIMASPDVFMC